MKEDHKISADLSYRRAEQQAGHYFSLLAEQVSERTYLSALTEDIRLWKSKHTRLRLGLFTKRQRSAGDFHRYMQWMDRTGRLDDYLDRSISYIYMRDLGQAIDSQDTRARIQSTAADVKRRLLPAAASDQRDNPEFISWAALYRWAQKEGVETAVIWVIGKLKKVSAHLPEGLDAEHAQRKLMKIILGVVLHAMEACEAEPRAGERPRRLDEAIRLGYSYGLTYPFIDDLLDAQVLTGPEKALYSDKIRTALLTGAVPALDEWTGGNKALIQFIQSELGEAFEYIRRHQRAETQHLFFEQAYVFFQAQEVDRAKNLSDASYTNEELYVPIILKSAYSRLIARSVMDAPIDEGFENRTFYYGIYNQLADDFADLFEDMESGAVTPYTYYLTYREQRPDLINPFELYWAVIFHLIHRVYRSEPKAREVILSRAVNGLKRCKARIGTESYQRVMHIFASGNPAFNRLVQQMVHKADDVDFFDKLLRDRLVDLLKDDRREREAFLETVETSREWINDNLRIDEAAGIPPLKATLIDAANYSLAGDGKRLRPILAWVMGVEAYGLEATSIMPLLKSLEYMHTASLIFDDLPTQDNADTRRGRKTLHLVHTSATAELTGLFLIQKAIQEQALLDRFEAKSVLALMQYSARTAEDLCTGQAMDLSAAGQALTLEQLNEVCFYKTGKAFEAALVMPAILAKANEQELAKLKRFAYHAGIAFQLKDDLLDAEGDADLLGKPVGKDAENKTSTFLSVLGPEEARKAMWEHYCAASEAVRAMPRPLPFLKQLLNYMIHRNR
ncbi:polyprenyl synthetase family protein [Paenibacillus sp. TRM 82003]|nr:polyprenyl synthetase family protein [Paenibacillus sp. TRM 82003]